jgi:hypothetical protein
MPSANFDVLPLSENSGAMSMGAESGEWRTGEGGSLTLMNIHGRLALQSERKTSSLRRTFDKLFWFVCPGNKSIKVRNSASRS